MSSICILIIKSILLFYLTYNIGHMALSEVTINFSLHVDTCNEISVLWSIKFVIYLLTKLYSFYTTIVQVNTRVQ